MAGKEDLQLLSSYIYSTTLDSKDTEKEVGAIGAVVMNRATAMGSMIEAIDSLGVSPDFERVAVGQIKEQEQSGYKRIVQLTSKLLRGSEDVTKGAMYYFPKKSKPAPELGLKRTHGTKSFDFYKQSIPTAGRVQEVQQAPIP